MSSIDYADAPVPVRPDLPAAHSRAWQRLAAPGSWWTGPQRVAIAAAVRAARGCALCADRKAALSPHTVEGRHDGDADLPEAALEVIHHVVTYPASLTRNWFQKNIEAGLTDAQYVELVGVVVTVLSIDSFCRGLGVPLRRLPTPEPGEPSRRRPPSAKGGEAWVPMLPMSGGSGEDADLWPRGRTGNVIRALSLVPDEVRTLNSLSAAHYLPFEKVVDFRVGMDGLDRAQVELLAGRVSVLNECFY